MQDLMVQGEEIANKIKFAFSHLDPTFIEYNDDNAGTFAVFDQVYDPKKLNASIEAHVLTDCVKHKKPNDPKKKLVLTNKFPTVNIDKETGEVHVSFIYRWE